MVLDINNITIFDIRNEVERLKNDSKKYLENSLLENKNSIKNFTITLKAFEAIVNDCKEETKSNDIEIVKNVLSMMYGIKTKNFDEKNISNELNKFIDTYLNSEGFSTTEKELKTIRNLIRDIEYISKILKIKLDNENGRFFLFKNRYQIRELSTYIDELEEIKQGLIVESNYKILILTQSVIDNFYNIYLFLANLIFYAKWENLENILIEIASIIDRIINIITPIYTGDSLNKEELLNHYAIFEFKELLRDIYKFLD